MQQVQMQKDQPTLCLLAKQAKDGACNQTVSWGVGGSALH
jgi:hypothetical protein